MTGIVDGQGSCVCSGTSEVYYDTDEGPALGPCIVCDGEAFSEWLDECELQGFDTTLLREDAALARRQARPDHVLGLPF